MLEGQQSYRKSLIAAHNKKLNILIQTHNTSETNDENLALKLRTRGDTIA